MKLFYAHLQGTKRRKNAVAPAVKVFSMRVKFIIHTSVCEARRTECLSNLFFQFDNERDARTLT